VRRLAAAFLRASPWPDACPPPTWRRSPVSAIRTIRGQRIIAERLVSQAGGFSGWSRKTTRQSRTSLISNPAASPAKAAAIGERCCGDRLGAALSLSCSFLTFSSNMLSCACIALERFAMRRNSPWVEMPASAAPSAGENPQRKVNNARSQSGYCTPCQNVGTKCRPQQISVIPNSKTPDWCGLMPKQK